MAGGHWGWLREIERCSGKEGFGPAVCFGVGGGEGLGRG